MKKYSGKIKKETIETIVNEICNLLRTLDCADEVIIYYNNKRERWTTWYGFENADVDPQFMRLTEENICPLDYFEWANPRHIISMSFDGSKLYRCLNYDFNDKVGSALQNILSQYDLYYELGDAWNLSIYADSDEDYENIEFTDYRTQQEPEPKHIWYHCGDTPPELAALMEAWYQLSAGTGDKGSCVIGAGLTFDYKGTRYFMSACSPYQGSLSWEEPMTFVKNILTAIGATNIKYDPGHMD